MSYFRMVIDCTDRENNDCCDVELLYTFLYFVKITTVYQMFKFYYYNHWWNKRRWNYLRLDFCPTTQNRQPKSYHKGPSSVMCLIKTANATAKRKTKLDTCITKHLIENYWDELTKTGSTPGGRDCQLHMWQYLYSLIKDRRLQS